MRSVKKYRILHRGNLNVKKMYSSRPARRSRSDTASRNSPLPVQVSTSSELAALFVREQTRIRQILHQGKLRVRVNAVYNAPRIYSTDLKRILYQ